MNDLSAGTLIGGYRIVEEVGQGGMATVYRAHQISMNRDVALKVLPPHFLRQPTSLERFKQEASIVARLEHRAIVPVHDYGEYEGMPYIVMRFMDGGSVADLLVDGPVAPERSAQILEQIAPALDYAHREGVLHRDLKSSNILLDANGDAYITDFGIARILGTNPNPLTTSGVVGTPSYMSPEQAQGHALDGRSDIYALGVVMYEMLAGVRPFEGETPYSVAIKHVMEPPPSPRDFNPLLPPTLDAVLLKVLEKNRERRYQTAGELADALKTALEQFDSMIIDLEDLPETEPSLNRALQAGAQRHMAQPPGIQVVPAYVPPRSRSYPGALVKPRRKRKASRLPDWLSWAALALLVGGLLLAIMLGGVYYLINSGNAPVPTATLTLEGYNATAIFKLTATRQAIELSNDTPGNGPMPTIPPTNTPRAPQSLP